MFKNKQIQANYTDTRNYFHTWPNTIIAVIGDRMFLEMQDFDFAQI